MSNLLMCPGCGQTASVDALGPAVDGRVSCPACGKSLTRLAMAATLDQTAEPPALADDLTAAANAAVPVPASRRHRRPTPAWALPAGIAAIIGLAALAGLAGYAVTHPTVAPPVAQAAPVSAVAPEPVPADDGWDRAHRSELLALKAEAEDQVLAGHFRDGFDVYRRLQAMAAAHAVRDPSVAELLRDAKVHQDDVYSILMGRVATATEPAPTSRSPDVPAVTRADAAPTTEPTPVTMPSPAEPVRTTVVNAGPSPALAPPVPLAVVLPGRAADQRVTAALDKGVDFLIGRFRGGQVDDGMGTDTVMHQGLDALCVYALLHAAEASKDPRLNPRGPFLSALIDALKSFPLQSDPAHPMAPVTYARSLRAAALAVYNRPEDKAVLRDDVAWLVRAQSDGSYTYDDRYANANRNRSLASGNGDPSGLPGAGSSVAPPNHGLGGNPRQYMTMVVPAVPAHALTDRKGQPIIDHCTPGRGHFIMVGGQPARTTQVQVLRPPPPPPGPPATYTPLQSSEPAGGTSAPDTGGGPGPGGGPPQASLAGVAPWDNSNSQYGLLGVWAGAEAGVEVPQWYWKAVEHHWLSCELKDGQWFYANYDTRPRLSMTCAGVASLLVTHEWLDAPALGTRLGRAPYSPALNAGLGWLEAGDNVTGILSNDTVYAGYSAYGVERCALASGFKFFGTHDWFAELSNQLIPYQFPNGAWGSKPDGTDALVNTGYMVLFLSRGRHPVLMNKLRMEPYWDNRPRDLANLTAFASKELERPFNWQVVSFARPWSDWMDAPVLYIASQAAPKLSPEDEAKLKAYADAGGLIFTHADGGSIPFTKWATDLAARLWPDAGGLKPLPKEHELYSVVFHLKSRPALSAVSNGSRLLLVHSPTDLSATWQERTTKSGRETFGLGVNLFVWAAGKSNFRNRLDTPFIPDPDPTPVAAVPVARLRYVGGAWDPEPYAWSRFARYFQWTTGTPAAVTTVDLPDLKPGQTPVAVLTGNGAVAFTDADVAAVRAYVTGGGTLLVDACGGSQPFAASAEALLGKAFPGVALDPLPDADPLLRGGGAGLDDLTRAAVRPYAAERSNLAVGSRAPALRGLHAGAGRVVYSPIDLTTGLLDTNSWGLVGYAPAYAQAAVKNLLLTAAAR